LLHKINKNEEQNILYPHLNFTFFLFFIHQIRRNSFPKTFVWLKKTDEAASRLISFFEPNSF